MFKIPSDVLHLYTQTKEASIRQASNNNLVRTHTREVPFKVSFPINEIIRRSSNISQAKHLCQPTQITLYSSIPVKGKLPSQNHDPLANFCADMRLLVNHIAVSLDETASSPNGFSTPASSSIFSCLSNRAQTSKRDSRASALS